MKLSTCILFASTAFAGLLPVNEKFIAPLRTDIPSEPPAEASRKISYTLGTKVLTGDVNIYFIFYGAWTKAQKSIVNTFANAIGDSTWYNTSKLYYSQANSLANKIYVNGKVTVTATVSDAGSLGPSLSGSNLPDLVQSYISSGALPEDENGIYFIATSGEISESIRPDLGTASFCSDYCGYGYGDPFTHD